MSAKTSSSTVPTAAATTAGRTSTKRLASEMLASIQQDSAQASALASSSADTSGEWINNNENDRPRLIMTRSRAKAAAAAAAASQPEEHELDAGEPMDVDVAVPSQAISEPEHDEEEQQEQQEPVAKRLRFSLPVSIEEYSSPRALAKSRVKLPARLPAKPLMDKVPAKPAMDISAQLNALIRADKLYTATAEPRKQTDARAASAEPSPSPQVGAEAEGSDDEQVKDETDDQALYIDPRTPCPVPKPATNSTDAAGAATAGSAQPSATPSTVSAGPEADSATGAATQATAASAVAAPAISEKIARVAPNYLDKLLARAGAKYALVDVRFPHEFDWSHIETAVHVNSFEELGAKFFDDNTGQPRRNGPSTIVVYGEFSGWRAVTMAEQLLARYRLVAPNARHPRIVVLDGGIRRFAKEKEERCVPAPDIMSRVHQEHFCAGIMGYRERKESLERDRLELAGLLPNATATQPTPPAPSTPTPLPSPPSSSPDPPVAASPHATVKHEPLAAAPRAAVKHEPPAASPEPIARRTRSRAATADTSVPPPAQQDAPGKRKRKHPDSADGAASAHGQAGAEMDARPEKRARRHGGRR